MTSEIRDLIPFGDIGPELFASVAREHPELPTEHLASVFGLGKVAIGLIDLLSRPVFAAGLSPARWRLLVTLRFQAGPEGASIGEIAGHLQIKEPTVTATVNRAVADGLVERRKLDTDRRVSQVVLTPHGVAAIGEMMPILASHLSQVAVAFGGPENITALTDTISAAVDRCSTAAIKDTPTENKD